MTPVHVVELDALRVAQQDHEPEDHVTGLQGHDQHGAVGDQRPDVALLELRGDHVPHLLADARHDGFTGGHALEERCVRGERHGLADRHNVLRAARLVGVFDGDAVPHGGRVGHTVGEALTGDDLFAQIGARHVREARHHGPADLEDRLREVERGTYAPADLVEELQAFADGDVLEVLALLVLELLRQKLAGGDRAGRPLTARLAFGAPGRTQWESPAPIGWTELQDGVAQFEDLGDDAGALAHAHAGQDLGSLQGQFLGAGEVGVQREAGRDALDGHLFVLVAQRVRVGGEHEQARLPARGRPAAGTPTTGRPRGPARAR